MFDSLDEQMKLDDSVTSSRKERYMKYSLIAVLSVTAFAALYLGLMMVGG